MENEHLADKPEESSADKPEGCLHLNLQVNKDGIRSCNCDGFFLATFTNGAGFETTSSLPFPLLKLLVKCMMQFVTEMERQQQRNSLVVAPAGVLDHDGKLKTESAPVKLATA